MSSVVLAAVKKLEPLVLMVALVLDGCATPGTTRSEPGNAAAAAGITETAQPMPAVTNAAPPNSDTSVTNSGPGQIPPATSPVEPTEIMPEPPSKSSAARKGDGDAIFVLTNLHHIKVTVAAAEWDVLQTSSARGGGGLGGTNYRLPDGRMIHVGSGFLGYFPWVHADIQIGDQAFKDIGLRYRGNFSFSSSSAARPLYANFKMKLDLFGAKGSWDGEKTFNFNAGVQDSSRTREAIAFAVFRAAGVPAPRTAYAQLIFTVPGRFQETSDGLYTLIENVNKSFLKQVLPPGTGLLFKPEGLSGGIQYRSDSWASYLSNFRPDREATTNEQQRLIEFARLISQPDIALFRARIGSYLDVDEFLRFIAVNALIANTDSYLGGRHNFYLYLDPTDDKFRFIPWDEDLSLGSRGGGLDVLRPFNGDQPLIYWLLDDPTVAARYRAIVKEIVAKVFNRAELLKLVDAIEAVGSGRGASPRSYLESRAAAMEQLVAGWSAVDAAPK